MKKLIALPILIAALIIGTIGASLAGDDLQAAYQKYSASHQKYLEALKSEAPQQTLDILYKECVQNLETYKKLGGKSEEPVKVENTAEPAASGAAAEKVAEGAAEQAAMNGETPVLSSAGQKKYDAIIDKLEKEIAASTNIEETNNLKIELASQYGRLKGDWAKANAILAEVVASTRSEETLKKAQELVKDVQMRVKKIDLAKTMNQMKNNAKELYAKYSALKWTSPLAKAKALASYYVGLFKYRSAVGKYNDFKKEYEKFTQNLAATDSTFDNLTDSEPITGNDITLLINGKCSFDKRYELARAAKTYIYLEYLSYKNDLTGNKLADILIAKAKEGLDVRVIIDYWTTFSYKKDIVYKLRAGGVKVALYNSPFKSPLRVNNRNHQKLFIVDDTYAITGGMNVGDDYANGSITMEGWRDTDILLQGPVVMEMKDLYLNNWNVGDNQNVMVKSDEAQLTHDQQEFLSKEFKIDDSTMYKPSTNKKLIKEVLREYFTVPPTISNIDLRFIAHYPLNKDDHVLETMVWYIDRASKEVILQTPYFLPSKRLEDSMIAASQRGVNVIVITNSMFSNDMGKYIVYASHYFFQKLIEKNIKIYEWYGCQTLHAKCNYFDGAAVTIGSYNLNSRSHGLDAEELILIENPEFAKLVHGVLMEDIKSYCLPVTLEEAKTWKANFSEKMKMKLFHVVDGIF